MKFAAALLLAPLVSIAEAEDANTTLYEGCDVDIYYQDFQGTPLSEWTEDALVKILSKRHNKLPFIGGKAGEESVLDALRDLDGDERLRTVHLYMRDIDFPSAQQNIPEGWRRGDIWPLARGAGITTKAGTDIHAKRPADWEIEVSYTQELFWGECGIVEDAAQCIQPMFANETPDSTAHDFKIKTPPEGVRGDVARAVLYTALRYGDELGLSLSDCPPFSNTEYGYLSELLRWHMADPVSDEELERNDRVCSRWQGNRNPLIDFPELVKQFFGEPDVAVEGALTYSRCQEPTNAPTATPNECSAMQPGDIHMLIFNSDPVDQMVFFPVSDIPEAVGSIFVTDKAWNGTDFVTDEGVLEYTIGEGGLRAGQVFAYKVDFPGDTGSFEIVGDSIFDLQTTAPDNILIYCMNADDKPHFLHALTYNSGFSEPGLPNYNFAETALPEELIEDGAIALPYAPNYLYEGVRVGDRTELIAAFKDPANYVGSNEPYSIITSGAGIPVLVGACLLTAMTMLI